jgi:hypothetical protein
MKWKTQILLAKKILSNKKNKKKSKIPKSPEKINKTLEPYTISAVPNVKLLINITTKLVYVLFQDPKEE